VVNFRELRELYIRDSVINSFIGFENIKKLDISGCETPGNLEYLENVVELRIVDCENIKNNNIIKLAKYGNLYSLTIGNNNISTNTLSKLLSLRQLIIVKKTEGVTNDNLHLLKQLSYLKLYDSSELENSCLNELNIITLELCSDGKYFPIVNNKKKFPITLKGLKNLKYIETLILSNIRIIDDDHPLIMLSQIKIKEKIIWIEKNKYDPDYLYDYTYRREVPSTKELIFV
jgi:hypothetical protein